MFISHEDASLQRLGLAVDLPCGEVLVVVVQAALTQCNRLWKQNVCLIMVSRIELGQTSRYLRTPIPWDPLSSL